MTENYSTAEVFVSGTFPAHTYNARQTSGIQDKFTKYLTKGGGDCLVVHGASKTGKTVLVERWLPPDVAIWIKGDEINSVEDLYGRIIDDLDLFTYSETTSGNKLGATIGSGIEAGLRSLFKFRLNSEITGTSDESKTKSRKSMNVSVVKSELRKKPVPIVLDDFHFMTPELRLSVAKAVKDLARLTRVILIAIPHAAFTPLQQLEDMDWRVRNLAINRWEAEELQQIANDGFSLLGISDPSREIANRLALESRGAPAIMQALCLEYATEILHVWATAQPVVDAVPPVSWEAFLTDVASDRRPSAFTALLNGKETRGMSRTPRLLHSGVQTDIYGATLYTLSRMGIVSSVSKTDVAANMATLVRDAPNASALSNTLGHLADIAEKVRGQSDPAITYNDPELQILDPFLAFYLAHGAWSLPQPRQVVSQSSSTPSIDG